MKKLPQPVTKLTGRVLKREASQLKWVFQQTMRPVMDQGKAELADRTYEIMLQWSVNKFPPTDMDVCETYGVVAYCEGINVTVRDGKKNPLGLPERFNIPFPEGKTIRVPRAQPWARENASVEYRGGHVEDNEPRFGYVVAIPDLAPVIEWLRTKQQQVDDAEQTFNDYVAASPLRRELAKRYPEVARAVWPLAFSTEGESQDSVEAV